MQTSCEFSLNDNENIEKAGFTSKGMKGNIGCLKVKRSFVGILLPTTDLSFFWVPFRRLRDTHIPPHRPSVPHRLTFVTESTTLYYTDFDFPTRERA